MKMRVLKWFRNQGWPDYKCIGCLGQMPAHPCYCMIRNAGGPGVEATSWQYFCRWVWSLDRV